MEHAIRRLIGASPITNFAPPSPAPIATPVAADPDAVARAFVTHYYNTFDSNRGMLENLYQDSSMLSFKGDKTQGAAFIVANLATLPFSQYAHDVSTVDSQLSGPAGSVIAFVSGSLLFTGHGLRYRKLEVILTTTIEKLEKAGETVKVAPGHFRNHLMPKMLAVPNIDKYAFLVKQFGTTTPRCSSARSPTISTTLTLSPTLGLRTRRRCRFSLQPAGDKELAIVLSTAKTKKQNKPGSWYHKSVMKKEFRKRAKAVKNQLLLSV